ncbi:hypothetical protein G9Q38_07135 [Pusillimonas sp. DMV24BSW_D]|uniref:hypothetical protein n=1 Tax=Neopusillimonas aestuarii TaxID=2716226 RepID=UPI00140C5074|nr:hypothetical protein [Pusillimonas sp. DMV24BSW_D]QIM48969.1 hypothetical protein G9Q38_07135 [Pusillimonas sp. DMV24BSW_D]
MREIYSRLVLWLIRPALERHQSKSKPSLINAQQIIDVMLKDLRKNGPISRGMKGGL